MAHWEIVYNWMMDNEDAARACAQVSDASTGAFNKLSRGAAAEWTPEAIARVGRRWRGEETYSSDTHLQEHRRLRQERFPVRSMFAREPVDILDLRANFSGLMYIYFLILPYETCGGTGG